MGNAILLFMRSKAAAQSKIGQTERDEAKESKRTTPFYSSSGPSKENQTLGREYC